MKTTIGIDYSLTSPAVTVLNDSFTSYFLTNLKKTVTNSPQFVGKLHAPYGCDCERYDNISNWVMEIIENSPPDEIYLEGYSFGSRGMTFQIAENMHSLKYKLWKAGFTPVSVPPTTIKKFATGKGNATKLMMYDSFKAKTGIDLEAMFLKRGMDNPISDIVDSFYIAQYGRLMSQANG